MEELFDKELQGMVKFTDATQQQATATQQRAPAASKKESATKNVPIQEKAAQRTEKQIEEQWQPVKCELSAMERLKACVKWVALFGGLNVLLFYWQQTGQMQSSAAVPSMCVCALLAGVGIGKHWKWK
jgi:hypothetical protein